MEEGTAGAALGNMWCRADILAGSGSQQNGCHGAGPWRRGHALFVNGKAFGTRRAEMGQCTAPLYL